MTWLWMMLLALFGLGAKPDALSPIAAPTPTIAVQHVPSVTINNEQFTYSYFIVQLPSDISLIPNFSRPKDVQTLMTENTCTSAVNGGFYDTAGRPLGYFFSNTRTYSAKIVSSLVNGFFWADDSGTALISTALPDIPYRFALQTGPMILFNGQTMVLTIQNDEYARRMVAGKTTDNQFVFLTVYSSDSVFSGPMLSQLPALVADISTKENLDIADAVNLDGGSASAFYSSDTRLSELTPVGSIFCVK